MKITTNAKIQKIVCYTFLIASCLVIFSSLCYFSSGWNMFTVDGNNNAENFYSSFLSKFAKYASGTKVDKICYSTLFENTKAGAEAAKQYYVDFYYNIQSANNVLFYTGFVTCVLCVVAMIAGNINRKKFYLSNLITGCLAGGCGIIMSVVSIIKSSLLMGQFNEISKDLSLYTTGVEQYNKLYSDRVIPFEATSDNCLFGIIFPIILIVISGLFIAYTVLKFVNSQKQNHAEVVSND